MKHAALAVSLYVHVPLFVREADTEKIRRSVLAARKVFIFGNSAVRTGSISGFEKDFSKFFLVHSAS